MPKLEDSDENLVTNDDDDDEEYSDNDLNVGDFPVDAGSELNDDDDEENNYGDEFHDDSDDDENVVANLDEINFADFTFVTKPDIQNGCSVGNSNVNDSMKTLTLDRDFTKNILLDEAKPGTWLYRRIIDSTPLKASTILTQYLNVESVHIAYMAAENTKMTTFYTKKK